MSSISAQSRSRERGILVIGAGLGHTGNFSLKAALEKLNLKTYSFPAQNNRDKNYDFWIRVANQEPVDFATLYEPRGYQATVDMPGALYFKEQLKAYPNAKVILPLRDPEQWYKSFSETAAKMSPASPYCELGIQVMNHFVFNKQWGHLLYLVGRDLFKNDFSKENVIECYKAHVAEVRKVVPRDRLLELNIGQGYGWEKLCDFLQLPIPNEPFPHAEGTTRFKTLIVFWNLVGWMIGIMGFGIPFLIVIFQKAKYGEPKRARDAGASKNKKEL